MPHVHPVASAEPEAGAATAGCVIVEDTALLSRAEKNDALLIVRRRHDAASIHALRAIHGDVKVRAKMPRRL